MRILAVVDDPHDWPLRFEDAEIVSARKYLADSEYSSLKGAKVFNLCRSYRYQSVGYYVSLLAAARGHKPIPDITTVQDLKSQTIIRITSEEFDEIIQGSLKTILSREFVLSIYFGHNIAKRYERLSSHLFKLFPSPFLRAQFVHSEKSRKWYLKGISPIAASEIPEEHRDFVMDAARDFFKKKKRLARKRREYRYDMAILYNPNEEEGPSDAKAIEHFMTAAESLGIAPELVQREDYGRIAEFDALFIRETTSVNHHTYRFARRAEAEGLVVIDDPESILKCTNKVFLTELLEKHSVPAPKTVIVHRENVKSVLHSLGLPCILKKPDSSFSQGVVKAESEKDFLKYANQILEKSDLFIAQEYMETPFDWRVGILGGRPLYVCKYFMAESHWQIIKRDSTGGIEEGLTETHLVEDAPKEVVRLALKAANLIGNGLYGVDIKQHGKKFFLIEVNDNPSIDAGIEDDALHGKLYHEIMKEFLVRIEKRKGVRE